jgi:hypothetical protein
MNAANFNELNEAEKKYFYKCKQCREMVDMRQLDNVLFHEDHVHRPDIQYGGSEALAIKRKSYVFLFSSIFRGSASWRLAGSSAKSATARPGLHGDFPDAVSHLIRHGPNLITALRTAECSQSLLENFNPNRRPCPHKKAYPTPE